MSSQKRLSKNVKTGDKARGELIRELAELRESDQEKQVCELQGDLIPCREELRNIHPGGRTVPVVSKLSRAVSSWRMYWKGSHPTEIHLRGIRRAQDTDRPSSENPLDFNTSGGGRELMHLSILAEYSGLGIAFKGRRCKYFAAIE